MKKLIKNNKKRKTIKKVNCILLFIFFLNFKLIQAQEEKNSKFNVIAYGGDSYGIIKNDKEPNYSIKCSGADILLNYTIDQKHRIGIATGIGAYDLYGNGFNSVGNFYHERRLLKIPLLLSINPDNFTDKFNKFEVITNLGFYAQNILKDEYRFLNKTQKNVYSGWNFGYQIGFWFMFNFNDNFSTGINLTGQGDLSKFKTENNKLINDKQKLDFINIKGIMFMIKL